MSNSIKVDLDLLKSYKSNFDNEKQYYMYNSYNTFSSGYISNCSDQYVQRMKANLSYHYSGISDSYSKINTWWTNFDNDLERLERGLSNDNANGNGINESCVVAAVNALPTLSNLHVDSFYTNAERRKKGEEYKKHYSSKAPKIKINTSGCDLGYSKLPVISYGDGKINYDFSDLENKRIYIDENGHPVAAEISIELDTKLHRIDAKTGTIISNYEHTDIYGNKDIVQGMFSGFKNLFNQEFNFKKVNIIGGVLLCNPTMVIGGLTGDKVYEKAFYTVTDIGSKVLGGVVGTFEHIGDFGILLKPLNGTSGGNNIDYYDLGPKYDMDQSVADIKYKGTDRLFEEFYDTKFGKNVKEKSFITNSKYEEVINQTACQIGETGTILIGSKLISLIFEGQGQEVIMGLMGGAVEAGKGAQRAVDYGADNKTVALYSAVKFGIGFVSYFGGAKINAIKIGKYAKLSSVVHIGADTATGATEGILDICADLILLRKEDGSKYTFAELYEEEGGAANIIGRAITAGIFSTISELGVLLKFNKGGNKVIDKIENAKIRVNDGKKASIEIKPENIETLVDEIYKMDNPDLLTVKIGKYKYSVEDLITSGIVDKTKLKISTSTWDLDHGFQLTKKDIQDAVPDSWFKMWEKNGQLDEILDKVNKKGYINADMEKFIKQLMNDDEIDIYIKTVHSNDVDSIFDGIRCYNNTTSGMGKVPTTFDEVQLDATITKVESLYELITILKNAEGLSQGGNPIDGTVILAYPKGLSAKEIVNSYAVETYPKPGVVLEGNNIIGFIKNKGGVLSDLKPNNGSSWLDNNYCKYSSIEYSDGIKLKKMNVENIENFIKNNVDSAGHLKIDSSNMEISPREMAVASLAYYKKYGHRMDDNDLRKLCCFVKKNYSSNDPEALILSEWVDKTLVGDLEIFAKNFPEYKEGMDLTTLVESKLGNAKNVHFAGRDFFDFLGFRKSVGGFNSRGEDLSFVCTDLGEDVIRHNIVHESIHQLSKTEKGYGLIFDERKGLNEAVTEFLADIHAGKLHEENGYIYGVKAIKMLVDNDFISLDELEKAYFSNDVEFIINAMRKGGNGYKGMDDIQILNFLHTLDYQTEGHTMEEMAKESAIFDCIFNELDTEVEILK